MLLYVPGEMYEMNGSISRQGSLAYVAQQAWIQNLTLRENILFGQKFRQVKYDNVIQACALKADLKVLMKGDATEIGENGINLSGGQKQRVSLARAVYSEADLFLLDDPLAAVDVHVGKHIFENVIGNNDKSILKGKTRVWVTNHISYLTQVDHVIVMENGKIVAQGSYAQLLEQKALSHIQETVSEEVKEELVREAVNANEISENIENTPEKPVEISDEDGKLIQVEASETGRVKLKVYLSYFKSLGYVYTFIFVSMIALQEALHLAGNIWLADWSDSNQQDPQETEEINSVSYYLWGYAIIGISEMTIKLTNDLTYFVKCARASKVIHKNLLNNVMRSPMKFFDTNPSGRIMNRFASDLDTIDQMIPPEIMDFTWCFIECIVVILLICVTTPYFIFVVIPLLVAYFYIQRLYINGARQLKRLYSISKSPIFSHFTETTNGAQTIRAYKHQERFIDQSKDRVTVNVNSIYLSLMSNRWLGIRLEFIGNFVIFSAAIFAVLARDNLTGGEAGLSITSSLQIIGALVWVVRQACQLETDCVSIERIMEYTFTQQEASWSGQEKPKWPTKGKIQFKGYQTRYRDGLENVLKGIDLDVEPMEKLGICGRTGAGKSSLTLALFRIIEPVSGQIIIDGEDITQLGLHVLRSKLTIIPQDPVLFTGDLRFNLDPIAQHSDEELWRCLELAHLKKHVVENLNHGLESEVSEGGSNFSVGQRQLICLARALLRKTKILILDEATAAVDQDTDDLIQTTLRKEFKDCTVLTIAHRLNTIMDSDRVAVFSHGFLDEAGSPKDLMLDDNSSFRQMAADSKLM